MGKFWLFENLTLFTCWWNYGDFFTIPLRKALIENAKLSYPEGQATAKVLQVGENARKNNSETAKIDLKLMVKASLLGALLKLLQSGFHVISEVFSVAIAPFKSIFAFGISLSPALLSVGFIIGRKVSFMVFSGGAFVAHCNAPFSAGAFVAHLITPLNYKIFKFHYWKHSLILKEF